MSNWLQMLKEAKEAFELGLIDANEFAVIKQEALDRRGQYSFSGGTPIVTPSRNDTLMGETGFGNLNDLSGTDNAPFASTDTLAGLTQFQPVGQTIGSYKVLGAIGQGGMGTVYRARHRIDAFAKRTGDVVVKLMKPELSSNPDFVDRFIGGAALGRSIKHPNFVSIHDVIIDPNTQTLAIVMDLVEGRCLDKLIPSGGMSFQNALPIIRQLSGALDYIHKQGIIHRDLKPENIIVQPDGTPIILDMGIAKNTTDADMSKTSTGMAMGTPLYMAPEQLDAKSATSSVDRYAFGLIVYQMLSGQLPWEDGLGQGQILARKFGGNLEPLSGYPKRVVDAVMGMLRALSKDRWTTCAEFMNVFVEREDERRKRELAERAEKKRLEVVERKRLEAIRLEHERKEQAERARLAKLKRQEEVRKRKEQERIQAEKRREREEIERKEREARAKVKREQADRERKVRQEAERQQKEEEERIARKRQERFEDANIFAQQYRASMTEIESNRTQLKSKLDADIESARTILIRTERKLEDGLLQVEQKRKSLQSKLSTDVARAKRLWNQAETDLEKTKDLLNERDIVMRNLTLKQRELKSLDGLWSSLMKSVEIAKLKDEIADIQQELSNILSVDDLEANIQRLIIKIASAEKSFNIEKSRLEETYYREKSQLNVDKLKESVKLSKATFNTAKENLEKAYQAELSKLSDQESGLNVKKESIEQEFPWFVFFTNPLDTIEFGVGMDRHEMVLIPRGWFTMGALNDDEDAHSDEQPCHSVTLKRNFLIGKYPVTQALWESVMWSNPSCFKGENRPVECVSWFEVVTFCNELSLREGLEPAYTINDKNVTCKWNANGYRLPTEAEWEYSARAGQNFKYSGSDNADEVAWYADEWNSVSTHPVGLKKPNAFGLYDMSGNVCEWVWDWKGDYSIARQIDPKGPDIGQYRVYRGGGWWLDPSDTRISLRVNLDPASRLFRLGFRLVRALY